MDHLKNLFNDLVAKQNHLGINEFECQYNPLPDYTALPELSDTSYFSNNNNRVVKVSRRKIILLPNKFLTH